MNPAKAAMIFSDMLPGVYRAFPASRASHELEERRMTANKKISARNQLRGTVEEIVLGVVTAKVSVRVGENLIESVITRQSVEEMGIKVGEQVTALIKSSEVMIMVD